MILHYSIVRFAPDPIRDEVVNLGLLMADEEQRYFRAAFVHTLDKVAAIGGKGAVEYARALIRDLRAEITMDGPQPRLFAPTGGGLGALLRRASSIQGDALRLTEPAAAVSEDPEGLFDNLFSVMVARKVSRRPAHRLIARPNPLSRDDMKNEFRARALDEWKVPRDQLIEDGVVGSIKHPVDFGLYNHQLRAVVHTVSFRVETRYAEYQRAVLAEAFIDLRRPAGPKVKCTMLYLPADRRNNDGVAVERSSTIFIEGLGIKAVPITEIAELEGYARLVTAQ